MPATQLSMFQFIWQGISNLAEDQYVNTFHFRNDNVNPTDPENVRDMLVDFYTGLAPDQETEIKGWMSNGSITGKWTVKAYDLDQPKPRYPYFTDTGNVSPGNVDSLPTENALVMSFQGARIAGSEQNKRRNRIYLGPFNGQANDNGLVTGSLVQDILFASKELLNASDRSNEWNWVVYSPTDDNVVTITDGWVDNAWDTQRRRGIRSTGRGVFDLDLPT